MKLIKFDYRFWNGGGWLINNGRGIINFIKMILKYSKQGYNEFSFDIIISYKNRVKPLFIYKSKD